VQALSFTGNDATTAGEREAGRQLDGGEDADQTLRDAVTLGDLPRQVILASFHAALKDVGPAGRGGDALRVGDDTVAGLPDVPAEVADDVQTLALEEAGEAETSEPERLKMAANDQPVHGGQRPDDLLRMHLLERGRHRRHLRRRMCTPDRRRLALSIWLRPQAALVSIPSTRRRGANGMGSIGGGRRRVCSIISEFQ